MASNRKGTRSTKLIYCRCKSGISIENAFKRQVQKFKIIFDVMGCDGCIIRIFDEHLKWNRLPSAFLRLQKCRNSLPSIYLVVLKIRNQSPLNWSPNCDSFKSIYRLWILIAHENSFNDALLFVCFSFGREAQAAKVREKLIKNSCHIVI